jgi:hypothetical protein
LVHDTKVDLGGPSVISRSADPSASKDQPSEDAKINGSADDAGPLAA